MSTPTMPPPSAHAVRLEPAATAPVVKPDLVKQRLLSLDAYRGLIMITLAFEGFGLAKLALNKLEADPGSTFWQNVRYQFSHAEWVGCSYWDMIQPSFMFMVGVSMAYSYTRRQREGQAYAWLLGHALWRSLVLIGLGVFLSSNGSGSTQWTFMNVLSQIGLGYALLFLFWNRGFRVQAIGAAVILASTWLLYVSYPSSGIESGVEATEVGVPLAWAEAELSEVGPAWHKNANVGHAIDRWFLNLFPQNEDGFVYNNGGYQTINFIPSLATMLFGLMAGQMLRLPWRNHRKLGMLLLAGGVGLASGYALHALGICPIVKRIWTPAWALFSTGWCCLILGGMFYAFDMLRWRSLAFPLVVVGMNSIAIYCMGQMLKPWVGRTLQTHFGQDLFLGLGATYESLLRATLIGLVFWLVCLWLYRQKIFIRI